MGYKRVISLLGAGALLVAAWSRPVSADTETAAALLAKHAAYVGWQGGDGGITTLRETGAAIRDGQTVLRFRRLQAGPIFRDTRVSGNGSFERGFTGHVFWQSNENGFTTRTVGDVVKFLASEDQLADEELAALPGTLHGNETVDGTPTPIVRVVAQGGLPVDLFIDPASGAYKRVVIDPDGAYETRIDVLEYATVANGKRVISAWQPVGGKTVYRYTDIDANVEISAEQLHPPKPRATWTFGPASDSVPIVVTDRRIFVDAAVNGVRGHFVLDTGAGGITFTDSFARAAGAKHAGATYISGIGGGSRANVYHVDTFALGSSTLHDVIVSTGIDERVDNADRIDGYVGFDLLAGAIVELDLDAQTLRVHDPAQVAPDRTQGVSLLVDLSTGQPRVPMIVSGRTPVVATLDTGNDMYVLFSSQLLARKRVSFFSPPDSLAAKLEFYGVNGHEIDQCGRLDSLELGPISYRPVPACVSATFANDDVLVGFDFLKSFNYVFDYPDGEILMTPRKGR